MAPTMKLFSPKADVKIGQSNSMFEAGTEQKIKMEDFDLRLKFH